MQRTTLAIAAIATAASAATLSQNKWEDSPEWKDFEDDLEDTSVANRN